MEYNKLEALPKEIGNLMSLEVLSVNGNKLSSLPSEIGRLIGVNYLNISYNNISELPSSIGNMESLRTLIIGRNRLSKLPVEIGKLSKLYEFNIAGSGAMLEIPNSICNIETLELFTVDHSAQIPYCLQTRHDYRLKIIIQ